MKKNFVLIIFIAAAVLLVVSLIPKGQRGLRIIGEGDRAPDFSLTALDGKQVSLPDLRGKIVMVHFWATWCPPCVDEIPTIDKLYRTLSGKDFAILAVSVDEGGAGAVASFMQRNGLALPALIDPAGSVAKRYGTFKFPETYIIDRAGIVKYKVIGPRDWSDAATVKALQEMAAAR
jgi:cytochrome c biogenesis protein CcmG/thiol:disulfide interchange protein DsbE